MSLLPCRNGWKKLEPDYRTRTMSERADAAATVACR